MNQKQKDPYSYRTFIRLKNKTNMEILEESNKLEAEKLKPLIETIGRFIKVKLKKQIKSKFRLSEEQANLWLSKQDLTCNICHKVFIIKFNRHTVDLVKVARQSRRYIHIDHDHKTRKLRGLLCNHCNMLLGMAKDDIETLFGAINFLRWTVN